MEKQNKQIEELKKILKQNRRIILILQMTLLITTIFYVVALLFYNSSNEQNKLLCEYSHTQTDIINELYPKWAKESCDEVYNLTILNKSVQDALCYQASNIKMPDKIEC